MKVLQSYVNGQWITPSGKLLDVINPAQESVICQVKLGTSEDTDTAVKSARMAFQSYSISTVEQRINYLQKLRSIYERRMQEIADAMTLEMGAPKKFAMEAQAWSGLAHFDSHIKALKDFKFEYHRSKSLIVHEAIGVVGLITPWNWPMNQMICKVAPALAAGCTMILKPSEMAPLSANLLAEMMHEAGIPKGVFNLLHGDGFGVGQALSSHPDVDMISFTGSARAGIAIAQTAAQTIKRITQELGGKSPNLILDDADFEAAVRTGTTLCMANSGQSCDAPSRMYVPAARYEEALQIAKAAAEGMVIGHPEADGTELGPVISALQFDRIQAMIKVGIDEGATLLSGGLGRPAHLPQGFYVRTTVFGHVNQNMRIAREEVFGPVLAILPYDNEEQLIAMANDSEYGLSAYVSSQDPAHASRVARRLRAGQVQINYPEWDLYAPFGGYKQSGNGREYADWGLHDFLETKGIVGHDATL